MGSPGFLHYIKFDLVIFRGDHKHYFCNMNMLTSHNPNIQYMPHALPKSVAK